MSNQIIIYLIASLSILSFAAVVFLWIKISAFMKGKNGESMESVFATLLSENKDLKTAHMSLLSQVKVLENRADNAFSKKGLVRFDAFSDTGAKQSFALALLNDNQDGCIISSLYSRERTSVFSKEVEGGICSVELSVEEKKALALAFHE
ncbi:MAG: hypothetical protein ACI9AR_000133 [Flavobacteriaceae bacterium]|jgi:hypothetical protein